jgi:diguanylate cyclase (GGDEF)-like protein
MVDEACVLGVSIGISLYPDDGRDMDTLLQHADTAMYSVKRKGHSGYRFYQEIRSRA